MTADLQDVVGGRVEDGKGACEWSGVNRVGEECEVLGDLAHLAQVGPSARSCPGTKHWRWALGPKYYGLRRSKHWRHP